jgi:hypothetical protein
VSAIGGSLTARQDTDGTFRLSVQAPAQGVPAAVDGVGGDDTGWAGRPSDGASAA